MNVIHLLFFLSTATMFGKDVSSNDCGQVQLLSEKISRNGMVQIEYIPSKGVLQNPDHHIERQWIHSNKEGINKVRLTEGQYEELVEGNRRSVLMIIKLSAIMDGQYRVYCGGNGKYTKPVTVQVPDPPSTPVFDGLQNIENCTECFVGRNEELLRIICLVVGGTEPLNVIMTIGEKTIYPQRFNTTTYIFTLILRSIHHMETVSCSVKNNALVSPLNATARMFVLRKSDQVKDQCDKQEKFQHPWNKLVIWLLGSCLLVTGIILAIILFMKLRHKRKPSKTESPAKVHVKDDHVEYNARVGTTRVYEVVEEDKYEMVNESGRGRVDDHQYTQLSQ